jgi:hypothetical protein
LFSFARAQVADWTQADWTQAEQQGHADTLDAYSMLGDGAVDIPLATASEDDQDTLAGQMRTLTVTVEVRPRGTTPARYLCTILSMAPSNEARFASMRRVCLGTHCARRFVLESHRRRT